MTSRYDEIASNLDRVREAVKSAATSAARKYEEITLIAVTKTFPVSDVHILASLDVHHYGENRDSEAAPKAAAVPGTWHFQGQIQSNKLKSIASWANVIHSLDEIRHIEKLDKVAIHRIGVFSAGFSRWRRRIEGSSSCGFICTGRSVLWFNSFGFNGANGSGPLGVFPVIRLLKNWPLFTVDLRPHIRWQLPYLLA